MPEDLTATLSRLIRQTDDSLWANYRLARSGEIPRDGRRLIFPRDRQGEIRVSEQEAKQILISLLPDSPFWYSVETPTLKEYRNTGVGSRSAATDLTLYPETGERWLNMEFKAHTVTEGRQDVSEITKDLKKLVREDVGGYWFHTLEAAGNNTIAGLWGLFRRELKAIVAAQDVPVSPKTITFHITVLKFGFSLERTVVIGEGGFGPTWLDDVSVPAHRVSRTALVRIEPVAGWEIYPANAITTIVTTELEDLLPGED